VASLACPSRKKQQQNIFAEKNLKQEFRNLMLEIGG
jgi:hypothetical protein